MTDIKIRCVVIEDEDHARKNLIKKLTHFEELDVIGEAVSVNESFKILCSQKPDVAFMDVKLIGGDIFMLLERLKQVGAHIPYIVILTGFEEYAMQALNEYHSYIVQYLKKPFSDDWEVKIRKSIDALMLALSGGRSNDTMFDHSVTHPNSASTKESNSIFISNKQNYQRLNFDDISYLEAAGNGATYIVTDHETVKIDLTITKLLEGIFPSYFIRISKANAINKNRLLSINRNDRTIGISIGGRTKQLGVGDVYYGELVKVVMK